MENPNSKPGTMNRNDWQQFGKNALIFAAPALLVFLLQIQAGSSLSEAFIAFKLWGLNIAVDFLRKLSAGAK